MAALPISNIGRRTRQAFGLAGLASAVLRRSVGRRFPALTIEQRLATVPTTAPLREPISMRWSDQHIPFIEANSERDAAVGLGIVHGHLRLAQMELMRRAAYGRIAEVAGDAALELDRLIRLIDFPRATEPSLAMMPDATREWVDGFADGINATAATLPPEFDILGITFEPWTAEDLFAVSRLCSADYAWRVWRTLNPLRGEPDWARMWAELVGVAAAADEDLPAGADALAEAMPNAFDRGSNCFALAGSRTETGVPMLACDPHHIVTSPNLWLIAGIRTPQIEVWGFMIPALPIFGVGRNQHGAWGGTNLHATSSELVDLEDETIESRTVAIPLRGGEVREIEMRESAWGPVISDAKPFHMDKGTVALHWLGHQPSDEFTPFKALMHAHDWATFEAAVDGYSLPGLNMIWAEPSGRIGKMIGAHIPSRPLGMPDDLVIAPADAHAQWGRLLSGRELPQVVDPESGFVVSSNEAPVDSPVTISLFFAAPHRFERITDLLGRRRDFTAQDLMALQQDVYLAPAHDLATRLVGLARREEIGGPVVDAMGRWDGNYAEGSAGALAFELIAEPMIDWLEARSPKKYVSPYWRPFSRLSGLIEAASESDLAEALRTATKSAEAPLERFATWGGLHRFHLQHPLARIPWLASRLPSIDFPTGGSNDTVMKTMHPFTQKAHVSTFGANARFVADLSERDGTFAVLLGGQDGWPGSRTMFDMVGAWRRGEQIRLPFTDDGLDAGFPHRIAVQPDA